MYSIRFNGFAFELKQNNCLVITDYKKTNISDLEPL